MDVEKDKSAIAFEKSLLRILQDSFVPAVDGASPWMDYVHETCDWIKENSPGLWSLIRQQSACGANAMMEQVAKTGGKPDVRDFYNEIINTCIVAVASIRFKLEKEHGTFLSSELEEEDL